jgi:hypothetical protein
MSPSGELPGEQQRPEEPAPAAPSSPALEDGERELAAGLRSARAVPGAAFRGALARHVRALDPHLGPRPARLRLKAGAALSGGALLIVLGALSATGHL